MTKYICAIIPARQGSKGVSNKNIKMLGGHPLIAYSVTAAKMTPEISRVIVSTDSEEYAAIARKYGAEVPFLRPQEIAGDRSTDTEFFLHAIEWFQKNEGKVPDYFVHLRPTTPLRDPSKISEAIRLGLSSKEMTSLRSAHLASETPLKWFKKASDNFWTSIDDDHNIESLNRARQEFPSVYIPDGYVDLIRTDFVFENKKLHGDKVLAYLSPHCIEVDTNEDFSYLEFAIEKNRSVLNDVMDNIK